MSVFYVVNPASKNGRTRNIWLSRLKDVETYTPDFRWEFTEGPMHAVEIARNACDKGFKIVVSVGGDGTLNEVLNGVMTSGKSKKVKLGILSLGTG